MRPLERGLRDSLLWHLERTPVVILEGPRASGKTTLLQQLRSEGHLVDVVDLSDPVVRSAANADPRAFVESLPRLAAVDEAQLADEITMAIKHRIDSDPSARFVLSGSYRIGQGALGGSDPLVGRSVRLRLFPFTLGERASHPHNALDGWFGEEMAASSGPSFDLADQVIRGGFPLTPQRPTSEYFQQSVWGSLHRDLTSGRDIERVRGFARHLLARTGNEYVRENIARDLAIDPATVSEWTDILESTHLLTRLRNYRTDPAKTELARARRKMHAIDTGFACWANDLDAASLVADRTAYGHIFETLVANELMAMASWQLNGQSQVYHWRQGRQGADEADLVVRSNDGRLIPIEVKLTSSRIDRSTFHGLDRFAAKHPSTIRRIVVYTGDRTLPFGDDRWAVPISSFAPTSRAT